MHTVHAVHTAHTYCANHHAKKYAIMQHYNTLRFQYLPTSCDCSPWIYIYTLCLSLHIQYFSYVVDAPQHFHFNAWIKHDQTSSNPSDTLLHIMPFISIHYHLYSFIISSNSLINYGTMGQDIVWVCLCVVHLPCWRCIVREMFMHVCVCVCTLAIKKWSRILLLLVWAFFSSYFLIPTSMPGHLICTRIITYHLFCMYVRLVVCVCLRACYKLGRYINECTDIHAFSQYD